MDFYQRSLMTGMKTRKNKQQIRSAIRKLSALFLCAGLLLSGLALPAAAEDAASAVKPDTWAAVDGLGRTVNQYQDVGDTREGKYVGLFYWTWHYEFAKSTSALNVTEIISQYPEARNDYTHEAWGRNTGGKYFFWDKPMFDYYINTDEYVVRKHAEMLADAGVDVIFFDCTNGTYLWQPAYETVFEVFAQAREQGVDTPQVAFMLNFGAGADTRTQLQTLYKDLYSEGKYSDLWFLWDGKPLVLAGQNCISRQDRYGEEILDFFTFRYCNPSYFTEDVDISENQWGWCSVYPQTKYGVREDGSVEQMTVNVAQNASDNSNGGPVAMNDYRGGVYGRGYAKGDYSYSFQYKGETITIDKETEDAFLYGLNFQQQWDYALEVDPDFIFITGWNEWVAIRQQEWGGTENAFADQYTDEYSRDIEPSDGVLKDHFYYQLVTNIRKFKGVQAPDVADENSGTYKTIDIHSEADQWADVNLVYNHYEKSTWDRNSAGWRGTKKYNYSTMRNDFVTFKVAYDENNVYFMAETVDDITDSSDPAWMRLLIDTDFTGNSPNWEGFEYIVNRTSPSGTEATVERSDGGWNFTEAGKAEFSVKGNRIQISIPRSVLGLTDQSGKMPAFNFKWADNTLAPETTEDSGDILDFYKYGDVAPGGRFMFSFNTELVAAPGSAEESGVAWYIWVCIGAAVVVVAAVVIVLVVTGRKKKVA